VEVIINRWLSWQLHHLSWQHVDTFHVGISITYKTHDLEKWSWQLSSPELTACKYELRRNQFNIQNRTFAKKTKKWSWQLSSPELTACKYDLRRNQFNIQNRTFAEKTKKWSWQLLSPELTACKYDLRRNQYNIQNHTFAKKPKSEADSYCHLSSAGGGSAQTRRYTSGASIMVLWSLSIINIMLFKYD
jgi:hypothetical protein